MLRAMVIFGVVALVGCGDDDTSSDTREVDAGEVSADASEVGADANDDGADASDDGDDGADGEVIVDPCALGATVEVVAGDADVRLTLCGATLTGAAPPGTAVSLTVVAAPGPLPFEHALVGNAYEVAGEDFFGELAIDDDGEPPGYRMAATHDASGWLGFEACPGVDTISFPVSAGIWAIFRDVNTYPASPQALGSGTVTSEFMGETIAWTFDDGYAIHDAGLDGLRSVTLIVRRTPSEGILQQLDVRMTEGADHTFTVLQVTLLDTSVLSGGWSWLEPIDGPLAISSIASTASGPIVGSFEAPLRKGDGLETMKVELDIETERYRFPPEGACSHPEG